MLALIGLLTRLVGGLGLGLFKLGALVTAPLRLVFDAAWRAIDAIYPRLLSGALSASWLVILAAGLLFAWAVGRMPALGIELLPEIHQGEFTMHVALNVGSPIENTDEVLSALDSEVRALDGVAVTAILEAVGGDLDRKVADEAGLDPGRHEVADVTVRVDDGVLDAAEVVEEFACLGHGASPCENFVSVP